MKPTVPDREKSLLPQTGFEPASPDSKPNALTAIPPG